jgi:hypothetical protein
MKPCNKQYLMGRKEQLNRTYLYATLVPINNKYHKFYYRLPAELIIKEIKELSRLEELVKKEENNETKKSN